MAKFTDMVFRMGLLTDEETMDEAIEEEYEEEEQEERPSFFSRFHKKETQEEEEPSESQPVSTRGAKMQRQSLAEQKKGTGEHNPSRIVSIEKGETLKIVRPKTFSESKMVADYLMENKTVVLNLERMDIQTAQRIIDCVGGVSYALGGSLEPISDLIFVVAPRDVEISGDLISEAAGEHFISPDLEAY